MKFITFLICILFFSAALAAPVVAKESTETEHETESIRSTD